MGTSAPMGTSALMGTSANLTRTPDRRLLPAAMCAWAVALLAAANPSAGLVVSIAAVAAVPVLVRLGRRGGAVIAAVVVAVGLAGVASTQRLDGGPLTQVAEESAQAVVRVTTTADARAARVALWGPTRATERVEVPVRVTHLVVGADAWDLQAPALLRLPGSVSHAPPAGSTLDVVVRIRSADFTREYAAVLDADDSPVVLADPMLLDRGAAAVRQGLRESLAAVPADPAALVAGLAVGDESGQSAELAEAMRVSGLSHLTAVSGGNTALVMLAVLTAARILLLPVGWRVGITLAALVGYLLVVGPEPSVLRAGVMGAVSLLAVLEGGPRRGLSALAVAVIVLLILSPPLAYSLGFALSVSATAGLLIIAPRLRAGMARPIAGWSGTRRRMAEGVIDALTLTLGAQIATAPILASLGDGLSLVSIPANLLAAPAVAPVTVLGLLAAIIAPWAPALAIVPAHLAAWPAAWIAWLAHTGSSWPGATLPWPGGLVGAGLSAVIVVAVVLAYRWRGPTAGRTLATVVAAALVVAALRPPEAWPPPGWIAVACDVGQGDALVLRIDDRRAVLVDAGPDPQAIDRCLRDLGVAELVAVVLTHFHADHVEGLPGVMRGRTVGAILTTPHAEPPEQADRVRTWAASADIPMRSITAGERAEIGDVLTWEALWPRRLIRDGSTANNASVVLLVHLAGVRFLLLGDAEPAGQVALRTSSGLSAAGVDVVKVAHHGSAYQDPVLPTWSRARLALVSAGAGNRYGHPAPDTLEAWAAAGAVVGRTDLGGDLAVVADGGLGLVARHG